MRRAFSGDGNVASSPDGPSEVPQIHTSYRPPAVIVFPLTSSLQVPLQGSSPPWSSISMSKKRAPLGAGESTSSMNMKPLGESFSNLFPTPVDLLRLSVVTPQG